MISTHIGEELMQMNRPTQAVKVQDAYRTSKSITMKRYIDRVQSPQCQIEVDKITAHFGQSWSAGIDEFREAAFESKFHLEPRISEQENDEFAAYMLKEKDIEAVIKSW
jgi:hypothetical protein